jgi:peptidoglycan biosynthesis protein MviN/MurJ (putative lipid II flippase)
LRQSIRPVVTAGMAAAPMAEVSLAAWPVAFSLSSIFWGPTMGLQQVTIALSKDGEAWRTVSRFVLFTGLILSTCLGLIAFTPLLDAVLLRLFGLSTHLAQFAAPSARIMAVLPLAYTFHALFTGLLVKREHTGTVRTAKLFNLLVVGLALFIGTRLGHLTGAILGSLAVAQGALLEAVWLYWRSRHAVKDILEDSLQTKT